MFCLLLPDSKESSSVCLPAFVIIVTSCGHLSAVRVGGGASFSLCSLRMKARHPKLACPRRTSAFSSNLSNCLTISWISPKQQFVGCLQCLKHLLVATWPHMSLSLSLSSFFFFCSLSLSLYFFFLSLFLLLLSLCVPERIIRRIWQQHLFSLYHCSQCSKPPLPHHPNQRAAFQIRSPQTSLASRPLLLPLHLELPMMNEMLKEESCQIETQTQPDSCLAIPVHPAKASANLASTNSWCRTLALFLSALETRTVWTLLLSLSLSLYLSHSLILSFSLSLSFLSLSLSIYLYIYISLSCFLCLFHI